MYEQDEGFETSQEREKSFSIYNLRRNTNEQLRRRIFCAQERMYQLEDIQEVIDSKYGEDFEVSDEQMSQILSLYEKYLSNDGDWRICAEDAIRNILF